MENLRIMIETWNGHVSSEHLAEALSAFFTTLSDVGCITCTIEGLDKITALKTSTYLVSEKKLSLDDSRVTKYGELSIKLHP